MNFNSHSNLKGKHSFLSPSKYHWVNYDAEKLTESYNRHQAAEKGVILHNYAAMSIELGQKLPRSNKTLNAYVNDAIGYKMRAEQTLCYSDNCFGTADAISFRNKMLRIHDLKTGVTPAHMEQLQIYAAQFCLEYGIRPRDIDTELRIYQNDEIIVETPHSDTIEAIMEKIRVFDRLINRLKVGEV